MTCPTATSTDASQLNLVDEMIQGGCLFGRDISPPKFVFYVFAQFRKIISMHQDAGGLCPVPCRRQPKSGLHRDGRWSHSV